MSAKFKPEALTRINTWFRVGTGSGRSSAFITSTLPLRVVTMARILLYPTDKMRGARLTVPLVRRELMRLRDVWGRAPDVVSLVPPVLSAACYGAVPRLSYGSQ